MDEKIKSQIVMEDLRGIRVSVSFRLTLTEFEALKQHAEKTGGSLVRKLVTEIEPQFEKVKSAERILKGNAS